MDIYTGQQVWLPLSVTDADGDSITWDVRNLPPGLTFDPVTTTVGIDVGGEAPVVVEGEGSLPALTSVDFSPSKSPAELTQSFERLLREATERKPEAVGLAVSLFVSASRGKAIAAAHQDADAISYFESMLTGARRVLDAVHALGRLTETHVADLAADAWASSWIKEKIDGGDTRLRNSLVRISDTLGRSDSTWVRIQRLLGPAPADAPPVRANLTVYEQLANNPNLSQDYRRIYLSDDPERAQAEANYLQATRNGLLAQSSDGVYRFRTQALFERYWAREAEIREGIRTYGSPALFRMALLAADQEIEEEQRAITDALNATIAADQRIARMTPSQRVDEVFARAKELMPDALLEHFNGIFTAQTLAVLAIWAGSHYFGVGFVVDGILLALFGFETGKAGYNLVDAIIDARKAENNTNMQAAAVRVAEAFSTLAVTLGLVGAGAAARPIIRNVGRRLRAVEEVEGAAAGAVQLAPPAQPPVAPVQNGGITAPPPTLPQTHPNLLATPHTPPPPPTGAGSGLGASGAGTGAGTSGAGVGLGTPAVSVPRTLPQHIMDTLRTIRRTNAPPAGYRGGGTFANDGRGGGQVLPRTSNGTPITYREFDVHPHMPGVNRGAQRIVIGSNGRAYYTNDHYATFTEMQ